MASSTDNAFPLDPAAQQALAGRIRAAIGALEPVEKRMFGGVLFQINDHMLCCITKKGLMVRVGKEAEPEALKKPHTRPCDGTGRVMPGFVMVAPEGVADDVALADWLASARAYVSALPPKAPKAKPKRA
jgi:hypothetical protein